MFGRLGTTELLLIFGLAILIFGPKQLPRLGKIFGSTIRDFKDSISEDIDKSHDHSDESKI